MLSPFPYSPVIRKCSSKKTQIQKKNIVSRDDIDKFQEQEIKKIRSITRNWFDRLFKQNMRKNKPKITRDKLKNKTINDIWTLFETEKEKENRKKKSKMKKQLRIK